MSIFTPEILQDYVLEIITRSDAIRSRCLNLLSRDFASDAPIHLSKTICRICEHLKEAVRSIYASIQWDNPSIEHNLSMLQITDYFLRTTIADNVQFIENAQTRKLPWSLINPMKTMVSKSMPEVEILLGAQWEYNYSIQPTSLYETFYKVLSAYDTLGLSKSADDVLSDFNKHFHIVSFPSLERSNVLLHPILGHEFGHLKTLQYIDEKREHEFLETIRPDVVSFIDRSLAPDLEKQGPLFGSQFKQQLIQMQMETATAIWQKGLAEILSDIVGCLLLGPAALFAFVELAIQDLSGLDTVPNEQNKYYPPWRMRLRNMYQILQEMKLLPLVEWEAPDKSVLVTANRHVEWIKDITNEKSDLEAINQTELTRISYAEVLKDIEKAKSVYRGEVASAIPAGFYDHLPHLVQRLECGIPPNAYEPSLEKRRAVSGQEILAAVWFHRLSWQGSLLDRFGNMKPDAYDKRNRLNRLALKAIEYSFIETDYRDANKQMRLDTDISPGGST